MKDAIGPATVIADGGYRGTGLVIPHRRNPGKPNCQVGKKSPTAHTARPAPASSTPSLA